MEESRKLIMKKSLRIALFSIGGLLVIISLMSIIAVFQLSKVEDGLFPFYVLAFVLLIVGIVICFFVPKLPKSSANLHMLSKEEKIIEDIISFQKKRRSLIVFFATFAIVTFVISFLSVYRAKKLDAIMTPENVGTMASFENVDPELPKLFSDFYILARIRALMIFHGYYFASWAGFFIAMIIFIAGLKRHDLTISIWERIKQLENQVNELRRQRSVDAGANQ